jgi:endonuclease/exonuclease/phosphatase (EEP) superfamily protein YafD
LSPARRLARLVCLILVGLLVILTLLPVFETDEWWVRLWDYPRLQIAALILVSLIAMPALGPRAGKAFWVAAGAGLAALAWQLWQVASYIPGLPVTVKSAEACAPGNSVRLLNANVLLTNRDYGSLIEMVEQLDPDLVLLLEPGQQWARQIAPVASRFPHRIGEPLENTYGLILLSKLPLEGATIRHLMQPHVPSVTARLRLRSGASVDFYGVHPEPPLPGDDSGERDAELVMVGHEVRSARRPAIVMGDLNDVAWSHTSRLFRRLSGTNDPRVGRGPYPTYPSDYPLLSWPLDHIFVTPHFELVSIDRHDLPGSDHRAMLFGLCLKRMDATLPSPAPGDREDAKDQIEEGREEKQDEQGG